jgi:uncharacterized protein YkwD
MAVNHSPNVITRARRRRPVGAAVLAVLAVLLLSSVLTSCETSAADRNAVVAEINASRARAGLAPLQQHQDLNAKADHWASTLRDRCQISHSRLADGAPSNWRKLGENVGRGGTISQVHVAYMNSSGHRANILDGSYNYVGAGAVWGNCNGYRTVFTVQVFMRA